MSTASDDRELASEALRILIAEGESATQNGHLWRRYDWRDLAQRLGVTTHRLDVACANVRTDDELGTEDGYLWVRDDYARTLAEALNR
ncbi:hypothetical protein [Williamsia sterculiae]|uniref:Uncharacterized protein n=1 Tax=Williamsia sterculiae TaxID=1344003 RepID=A0A1N7HF38_9NOCA|nr:hypothetical protein [Williamsia sterculiae]SIS23496.1 hypothetical protein SAMN05445060_4134 [Williamsia sterculiae]